MLVEQFFKFQLDRSFVKLAQIFGRNFLELTAQP
jgi:hypothetical protein